MKTPKQIQEILHKAECLYDLKAIEHALDEMAKNITAKLEHRNPIILCVMVGALIPTGHLLTRLKFPVTVDYIHATRYQGAMRGGDLHWLVEPRNSLKDRTVLVVDDILDGGLTLGSIVDYCQHQGAKETFTAAVVDKKSKREKGGLQKADFVGVQTEDRFLFGFGLDYEEYLRNAPGIYAVAKEHEEG